MPTGPKGPPLHDERPTSAQLKADIESGRSGDKNPVHAR
jgi:hypothetical protein